VVFSAFQHPRGDVMRLMPDDAMGGQRLNMSVCRVVLVDSLRQNAQVIRVSE
jgi:hypothetical protein